MEIYGFVRGALAWMASIACLIAVNSPLLYATYRIGAGRVAEDDETRIDNDELWTRSLYASGVLAVMTAAFLFVNYVVAVWADGPAGIVHFATFLAYLPAAAFVLTYFFAQDDFFKGLGHTALFFGLSILPLYLIDWFVPFWSYWVGFLEGWLKPVVA
jgi:hypothetical protein